MWCNFIGAKEMFKKIYYSIMLLSADSPTLLEKLGYLTKLILTFAPIAYVLNGLGVWFNSNTQFFSFVLIALSLNMIVGARFHYKNKTFKWDEFFKRNCEMWSVVIVVYILLEMLRKTAGDNIMADGFKIVVQLTTLLYPISKALKNIYILTGKKYPPKFIMDKIYNFEKNGNVTDLLSKEDEVDKKL